VPTLEERIAGEDQQLLKAANIAAQNIGETKIDIQALEESGIKKHTIEKDSYSMRDYDLEVKQSVN
jgi:hypothetical protein